MRFSCGADAKRLRKLRIPQVLGGSFLQGVRLLLINESPADCCESFVTHQRSLRGGSSPDRASSSCSTDVGVGLLAPPFSNNSSRYGELGEDSLSPTKSSVRFPRHSSTCQEPYKTPPYYSDHPQLHADILIGFLSSSKMSPMHHAHTPAQGHHKTCTRRPAKST